MRFLFRHLAAVAIAGAAAASTQQTAASTQQTATITNIPTTSSSSSLLPTPQVVEIDVVFPRWKETYSSTELFPIVLSVQNLAAWQLPNSSNTTFGHRGMTNDFGVFHILPNPSPGSAPTFLVALANHSTWHDITGWNRPYKLWGDKYVLEINVAGSGTAGICDAPEGARLSSYRAVMFDMWMEGSAEETVGPDERYTKWGVPADLMAATGCPQVAAVAKVTTRGVGVAGATATTGAGTATTTTTTTGAASCGVVASDVGVARGNPCAVTVDRAMMSSVSSAVASLSASMVAAAVEAATARAAGPTTRTSRGGAGGVRPVQAALAAACVLCGLAAV
ncbi:hypothetical protein C8A05DRAFT_38648 [Staphylotrichum tortipilum]|uniref:DUF7136 domain-containing protein n=1 Tax=Staphylotrichum tortipilum TaxID=2831512 RepID=A0AAN6RP92_9PEZI|nr:hypothetical protein C8A05DRAFT_38648 [Staphylotrichum longicolle]